MALPRSFLSLRECFWPCEITFDLARSFLDLQNHFWPCRDCFWPCKIVNRLAEIVFGLAEIFFGLAEIVFGLARSFFGLVRSFLALPRSFLALRDRFWSRKKVRSKLAKDNIDCPNGIISSTKNFYLGISKGHLYNIFRFHTFMFKSSCKTGAINKTV